jgi:tripartite-type tricarboxylate transporter receptor subunit TctC
MGRGAQESLVSQSRWAFVWYRARVETRVRPRQRPLRVGAGPSRTPELRNAILNLGAQPQGGTPEDFGKVIAAEVPKWAGVVKASGTKVY